MSAGTVVLTPRQLAGARECAGVHLAAARRALADARRYRAMGRGELAPPAAMRSTLTPSEWSGAARDMLASAAGSRRLAAYYLARVRTGTAPAGSSWDPVMWGDTRMIRCDIRRWPAVGDVIAYAGGTAVVTRVGRHGRNLTVRGADGDEHDTGRAASGAYVRVTCDVPDESHTPDRVTVWRGAPVPRVMCGWHAHREAVTR